MKRCRTCKLDLPTSDFHRAATAKDGLHSECRTCAVARAKAWRAANRERSRVGNHAYRQRHRDRQNARGAVQVALRRGTLTRQPCEACGTTEDVQAHHDDYAKRLDVRWLCRTHHAEADRERRAAA